MIKYNATSKNKTKTIPRLLIYDVVLNPNPCIKLLILSLFSLRSSFQEILFVKKLTSTKLKEAITYIYIKNDYAFPGI